MEADIRKIIAGLVFCILTPYCIYAQNTLYFSVSDTGQTKAIAEWGADTCWPSTDNMRQCIIHMGADQIDVIRLNFFLHEALTNGQLGADSKAKINNQLNIAAMAGTKPLVLSPATGEGVNTWYKNILGQLLKERWVAAMEAAQAYIGRAIYSAEPFNEPDYSPWGQGTQTNLYEILGLLQNSPNFSGTILAGASTLNSDSAKSWYDTIKSRVTVGSTHQLAGSTNSYVDFIQYVLANGDSPCNPELHSLAEAIYGAEYGLERGIWWGAAQRTRGLFVRSCKGKRLGYAENRGACTAAAVYRAPDGRTYGFAGGFERQGSLTPYRLVCTDQDVYFNGIGPIRQFMLPTTIDQETYADIEYGADILPPLDGNRWKIVNRKTGKTMQVAGGSLVDGGNINGAADIGALYQRWNIVRQRDGYYRLFNANSGRTAEVADWSLNNAANIRQWGKADNFLQSWFIDSAGGGYYYIRNAHSGKYMMDSGSNIYQWEATGNQNQQWQFIADNPPASGTLTAHYEFENNAHDSAGSNNGTTSGSPAYAPGVIGRAVDLDGTDDFVTLPTGIANSNDITIAAWVNWDGGSAWQRIFDFGNDTASYMFLSPSSADGTLRFAITMNGNANEQILDTDPLSVGQWVHLAVVLCGNTGLLYLNGTAAVAGQILLNPSDINPLKNYIGKSQWPDPLFNGRIDDFRIYNYALSAAEIACLSSPPFFTSDSILNTDGIERAPYAGQSLAEFVDAPQGTEGLTFSKESGPDWLVVANDGMLSGVPGDPDVGWNVFTVGVQNQMGLFDTASMTIHVLNVYSGVRGTEDLAGLAGQWLRTDCPDMPGCGGADLDGDGQVTLSDLSILAQNWLGE